MNKNILKVASFVVATIMLTACDNDPEPLPGPLPNPAPVLPAGAFIVNAGNMSGNIDGSLSFINYATGEIDNNIFAGANSNIKLGDTPNAGLVYDGVIYIAVTGSEVLQIIDANSFKLIKTLSTSQYGAGPRRLCVYEGSIYITLFKGTYGVSGEKGYLARLDPSTLEITAVVEVGPQPEYVVAFNDRLYVAVSDGYGYGSDACIAVVDPETFTVSKKISAESLINPVCLVTNGTQLYVSSWGTFLNEPPYTQTGYGVFQIENDTLSEKICDGIQIDLSGNYLYYISDPYTLDTSEPVYGVYNTVTGEDNTNWLASDAVDSPISLGVDPVTAEIFILSYNLGDYGFASYDTNGYVRSFTPQGATVATYQAAIAPTSIFFNY